LVLVLLNGRPLALSAEVEQADALLEAWSPGIQGGNAVADVVFGDCNPAGRLTTSFPRNVGQIPIYYNHLATGRPYNPESIRYSSSYIDVPNTPLFPFGFGLSYTEFVYGAVAADKLALNGDETLTLSVTVTNCGERSGEEVVQLYLRDPVASIARPVKELKGFEKIRLTPGQSRVVRFTIRPEALGFYKSDLTYVWEAGDFDFFIGPSSATTNAIRVSWQKPEPAAAVRSK